MVGFEAIPETDARVPQHFRSLPEEHPPEAAVLGMLAARGYEEAITLAFVDPVLQERLFPGRAALALSNPIASDLSVMRVSLWPGLLRAALENQRRQADRIRLFEHGTRFEMSGGTREIDTLAGLACGARLPEQWGVPKDMRAGADFYDMKGDLAALFAATGARQSFRFEPGSQPALHPGRTARVLRCGQSVGWLGELHPRLVREFDLPAAPVLFELDQDSFTEIGLPSARPVSKLPVVRRDLAVVVDDSVPAQAILDALVAVMPPHVEHIDLFDVYRGAGIEPGKKSLAILVLIQDTARTLTDAEIDATVAVLLRELENRFKATLRQ